MAEVVSASARSTFRNRDREASDTVIIAVASDDPVECLPGKKLQDLGEQGLAGSSGVRALLCREIDVVYAL